MLSLVHTKREVRRRRLMSFSWWRRASEKQQLSRARDLICSCVRERPAEANIPTKTLRFVIPTLVLTSNGYAHSSLAQRRTHNDEVVKRPGHFSRA